MAATVQSQPLVGSAPGLEGPSVHQADAAILREALAAIMKRSPPAVQHRCHQALSFYAARVSEYCNHPQTVFIKTENKEACLDCGKRVDRH